MSDDEAHRALAAARIDELRRRAQHPPGRPFWTLAGMLAAWSDLVDLIDRGYDRLWEEYMNELGVRDLLEKVLEVLPPGAVRERVVASIEATDERFRRVTRPLERRCAGPDEAAWWWGRAPLLLVGDLEGRF